MTAVTGTPFRASSYFQKQLEDLTPTTQTLKAQLQAVKTIAHGTLGWAQDKGEFQRLTSALNALTLHGGSSADAQAISDAISVLAQRHPLPTPFRVGFGVDPSKLASGAVSAGTAAVAASKADVRLQRLEQLRDDLATRFDTARKTLRSRGYLSDSGEMKSFIAKHGHILEDFKAAGSSPTKAQLDSLQSDLRAATADLSQLELSVANSPGREADTQTAIANVPPERRATHQEIAALFDEGRAQGWLTDDVVRQRSGGRYDSLASLDTERSILSAYERTGVDWPDSELASVAAAPGQANELLAALRALKASVG